MQIIVEKIENPDQEFWIWNKKITNKQEGRVYPSTTSNVGSGISVAIYQTDENDSPTQVAQLQLPDYEKLLKYYSEGKQINLDYTYLDDFTWLGDKKPYEVENLPHIERIGFSARCAFFNNQGKEDYLHIMQSKIAEGDMDFSHSAFYNINLYISELMIEQGNLIFDSAHFYNAQIGLGPIVCGGNQYFSSEISFRYTTADNATIETLIMTQKLSLDFLCAKMNGTTIALDPLPANFKEICFTKVVADKVTITNAEIDSIDMSEANIKYLGFKRCKFMGYSEINGNIHELHIDDCLNSNVFKLSLTHVEKLTFSNTINNGKFCISNFSNITKTIKKSFSAENYDAEQLLMLKENFRQIGEYENEDICHLYYQRLRTRQERNMIKKAGRYLLDGISGYGTKPARMLLVILTTIVLFGMLYYFVPGLSFHGVDTWLEHIYASGITFFAVGYGDLFPLNVITKMISLVEAFLGVTTMSYFLVLLSRKVIR